MPLLGLAKDAVVIPDFNVPLELEEVVTDPTVFPPDEWYRAKVISIDSVIESTGEEEFSANKIVVQLLNGPAKGSEITIIQDGALTFKENHPIEIGDTVVVLKTQTISGEQYYVTEQYRLPALLWITLLFLIAVVILGRSRGFTSIIGLGFTVLAVTLWIVPRIAQGADPLLTSLAGAFGIALISLYLAHGFSRRTSIALASTIVTLGIAAVLALVFVELAKLFGTGSEEAVYLQIGQLDSLNLKGLLLGGIIIGVLGVLDDITISQTTAIEELRKANPSLSFRQLYRHGITIGREHIASLVNTLLLAYAGASLPLFLFFTTNSTQPLWSILNSAYVAEEIVRTLVGSTALVVAVPIATLLAAYMFTKGRHNPAQR